MNVRAIVLYFVFPRCPTYSGARGAPSLRAQAVMEGKGPRSVSS
jgi:hypothetical protein